MIKKYFFTSLLIALFFFGRFHAASALPASFNNQLVSARLSLPTDFAFAPDGRVFITEQNGQILIFKNNQLLATPAASLNVGTGGDRGLLSITLDPNFSSNQTVYLLYTSSALHQRISKFTMNGDTINVASEQVLLENPRLWSGFLNAGALRFGTDGKLYASFGSDGTGLGAQDLSTLEGKVVRISSDGSIPADNPFVNFQGAQKSIFASGFRNPWRLNVSNDGKILVGDVGQSLYEKIVRLQSGANFGWPTFEGDCTPSCGGITPPLLVIPHNGQGRAVVGGEVVKGNNFPASYANAYFFGDYVQGTIQFFGFDASGNATAVQNFDTGDGSIAAINFGPDGCLWYLDIFPGELHKICYGGSQPVKATATSDKTSGGLPLTVNFSSTGSTGQNLSYSWNFGDGSAANNSPSPTHTYTTKGVYTATLTVSSGGANSTANITIWAGYIPPNVTITSPSNTSHYNGGSVIQFSATAQDTQDGNLPGSNFIWNVIPHHNTHIHTPVEFNNVASGSFAIPQDGEPGADTWYEFKVTATNSAGLSSTASVNIYPNISTITITTNPGNLSVLLDGQPFTAPHSEQNVVGMHRSISVASPQTVNNSQYSFSTWSDGGSQTHQITIPPQDTTYTANFSPSNSTPQTNCDTVATGSFTGCYYSGQNFDKAILSRNDTSVNFDWGGGSPDPSIPADHFSARWQGDFNFNAANYTFTTTADDGVRVSVDNNVIIDKWVDQPATTYTATANLTAGTHLVKMEYYENGGQAVAKLSWKQSDSGGGGGPTNFAVSASLPNSVFTSGANSTVTTNITSTANLSNVNVDTEIYDSGGNKVNQRVVTASLTAGQQFSSLWNANLPSASGKYTIKVGVFTENWSQLYFWNNNAFQFSVGTPAGGPQPGQNYPVNVLVPQNGQTVSGTIEIKAVVPNLDINSYNIGWRTGNGTFFTLDTDPVTQNFKHAWIDFTNWTWNVNGQYPLEFEATNLQGTPIGDTTITVIH